MDIKSDLRYLVKEPALRSKFENLKKRFYKEHRESTNAGTEFPRVYQEYKRLQEPLTQEAIDLLNSFYFKLEEDGAVYLIPTCELNCDILIRIPRGVAVELKGLNITEDSAIELANIFNSYGTEGFSVRVKTDKASVVIEPTSAQGVKGVFQTNAYSLQNDGVVVVDAKDYTNCLDALKIYQG